jgi:hypothetical protein
MERSAMNGKGVSSRLAYILPLIKASTYTGAMALWLNDISAGRDPREAFNEDDHAKTSKFVVQAFLKGGGGGVLADFVSILGTRSPVESMTGPGMNYMLQGIGTGLSAVNTAIEAAAVPFGGGEDIDAALEQLGKNTLEMTKKSIPMQNLWWAKGVLHNYMLRDVYELMSPGYTDRIHNSAEKNYSAGYWTDDPRMPNISNIIGRD